MMRLIAACLLVAASVTRAGVAITLVPNPIYPTYFPGDVVNIEVYARLTAGTPSVPGPSGTTTSIRVRHIQFDFTQTDEAILVEPINYHSDEFIPFWNFESTLACSQDKGSCGVAHFIDGSLADDQIVSMTFWSPSTSSSLMINLKQDHPTRIGGFKIMIPIAPSNYVIDVLNATETHPDRGARVYWGFGTQIDPLDPTSPLRADTGQITGGRLVFGMNWPWPDCNENFVPDENEDCDNDGLPDSCEVICGGSVCGCVGPYAGTYDGPSHDTVVSSLDCNGWMTFQFVTAHGPILFQTAAQMTHQGVITGQGTKIQLSGQFDFETCTATGTWNLFGGKPGTWTTHLTRECLPDCNNNLVPDSCDIDASDSPDCNENGIPDECDLANVTSFDCNHNDIPDECEDLPVFAVIMTDPPSGTVDVRQDRSITGLTPQGIDRVRMRFTCAPHDALTGEPFSEQSFDVESTSGVAPLIFSLFQVDSDHTYDVFLTDPIPPGAWTTIKANVTSPDGVAIDPESSRVVLGSLPGDVSGNGRTTPSDILMLIDQLNGQIDPPLPARQCDMDRSGVCAPADIVRLIDLLNGTNTSRAWNNVELPPQP